MKRKSLTVAVAIFGLTGIVAASTAFWYHHNFRAGSFKPVQLSQDEKRTLGDKLSGAAAVSDPAKTIVLSEREINGWLEEQGLGDRLRVGIHGGCITANALLPVDANVPFIGGHTVRLKIALKLLLEANHHLGLQIADLAVGGISPPNAWLGGIKGRDLLADTNLDPTAKAFAEGIKAVEIGAGQIRVMLND